MEAVGPPQIGLLQTGAAGDAADRSQGKCGVPFIGLEKVGSAEPDFFFRFSAKSVLFSAKLLPNLLSVT